METWARVDGGRTYAVTVHDLPDVPPAAQGKLILDNVAAAAANASSGVTMTEVSSTSGEWKGYPFKQVTLKKPGGQIVFVRAILAKATLYVLDVDGEAGMASSDPAVAGYLDGFEPQPKNPPVKKGGETQKGAGPIGGITKKKNPKK